MGWLKHQTVMGFARSTVKRAAIALFSAQAVVIVGLVGVDTYQKRQRTKRDGFPQPGTFRTTIADTDTTVYTYGEDLYDAMIAAIDRAEHQVLLETYIWKGDHVGTRFRDAVNRAAERGVKVFVIYDGFANLVVNPFFYRFHPLVNIYRFPVVRPSIVFTNIRGTGFDHRKVLVVDDEVGFVGGYNIGSDYATKWRDTHLEIRGPSVWELREAFVSFWNFRAIPRRPELPDLSASFWEPRIRAVNNIPANLVFPIRGVYLDAINRADRHIFITMAYFIPDRQILDALLRASRRGVDVRVILPEDSNHVVSDWLSRGFYSALIGAGVQILLYQNSMIHAKTATVDGEWSTIGTANIDRLSLTGNYEINLEIFDRALAATMEEIFAVDSSNCRRLSREEWESRHVVARVSELILAPLRPFL
ncbi:phospholipase D-like domain-containing protein [Arthrobacter burdickii]|uniref:Phospholipase D-like domain-containing protein n=1 Tax=Arthrobacter burdickii TaxID=3035920 RepID=A0ABT8K7F6_9MICC|nr:phospholipase D-like domain-containing protein [Arthrobacter burdickii]MDN4612437.1 phospholipase D-like domain-containing protein [Arthrobacter burdickii]